MGMGSDLRKGVGLRLMIVVVCCSTVALGSWPLATWHVNIVNELSSGQILSAHCKSKNDDLGAQNVVNGSPYGFSFKDNVWQTTLFYCYLNKPNNAHAAFDVYWYDNSKDQWLYTRCGNTNTCIWIAKDDGIYIKNNSSNQDELAHPWQ